MMLKNNILKARSHIAFCIGLCAAAAIALSVETGVATSLRSVEGSVIQASDHSLDLSPVAGLSDEDRHAARVAWRYFQANTQPTTGLVNSVHNYPSTTIWDQSSYLLALISAQRIGIIDFDEFDRRMGAALSSLAALPLFDDQLPNKAYDTRNLQMTNYQNQPVDRGIGWSALDVARMTVPMNIVLFDYPEHAPQISQILSRWKIANMLANGQLMGARVNEETGHTELVQEGRLGYEEYAARAVGLLGLDALKAGLYDDYIRFVSVAGQQIAVDSRSYAEYDAHNYVVSEPYILTALEFGLDTDSKELAYRIYLAQKGRFDQAGIPTAVSEDNIDQTPYFLYNTVYANGKSWNTLAEDGSTHDDKRTVSTKAVFGWDALFDTEYTALLRDYIAPTETATHGWVSGVYEADDAINNVATANTNAIILETFQYKLNGPLIAQRFSN